MDDRKMLHLVELGMGTTAMAKLLYVAPGAVVDRLRKYLKAGILRPGYPTSIDWRAFGKWKRIENNAGGPVGR